MGGVGFAHTTHSSLSLITTVFMDMVPFKASATLSRFCRFLTGELYMRKFNACSPSAFLMARMVDPDARTDVRTHSAPANLAYTMCLK